MRRWLRAYTGRRQPSSTRTSKPKSPSLRPPIAHTLILSISFALSRQKKIHSEKPLQHKKSPTAKERTEPPALCLSSRALVRTRAPRRRLLRVFLMLRRKCNLSKCAPPPAFGFGRHSAHTHHHKAGGPSGFCFCFVSALHTGFLLSSSALAHRGKTIARAGCVRSMCCAMLLRLAPTVRCGKGTSNGTSSSSMCGDVLA